MCEDPSNTDADWHVTVQEKKELLGDTLRESGGPGSAAAAQPVAKRQATDMEPVSFHGNSVSFWKEIYHSYWAGSIVDFTPQNDNAALAAVMLKKKYLAIVNTEAHAELLMARLQSRVFQLIRDPECEPLYEAGAVSDLEFLAAAQTETGTNTGAGTGAGRGKGKGAGKSKGKKGRGGKARGQGEGESQGAAGKGGNTGKGGTTGKGGKTGKGGNAGAGTTESLTELLRSVQNSAAAGGEGQSAQGSEAAE